MQYHQIIIFFHRPWVSKSYIQPRSPRQGPGYHHARRMCIESATAIARLLHIYEKHYTFRRMTNQAVAIIFSAALMLLFVTVSSSALVPSKPGEITQSHPRNAEMVAYLNLCFRALDELGQSFENAKRTRDYLVTLQRRWQTHMRRSGPRAKRQMSSANLLANAAQQKPASSTTSSVPTGQPAQTTSGSMGSDVPRKKSRLVNSNIASQNTAHNPSVSKNPTSAPFTADHSYESSQSHSLASQQNQQRASFNQQPFSTQDANEFDWIRTSDLNLLSGAQGPGTDPNFLGGISTAQFPDDASMLPDLGDIEGWWGSPNGNSGLGGPNL